MLFDSAYAPIIEKGRIKYNEIVITNTKTTNSFNRLYKVTLWGIKKRETRRPVNANNNTERNQ